DYVLSRFRDHESDSVSQAVQHAARGVECWVEQGLEIAMNQVNAPE
ncbi:MAG: aminoacyl-tRNA hydrolase, partial [Gimesia chilikensis]